MDVLEETVEGDVADAGNSLNERALARIILFNHRQQGEAFKITIEEYKNMHAPSGEKVVVVVSGLSPVEQELCKCMQPLEITGKRGEQYRSSSQTT